MAPLKHTAGIDQYVFSNVPLLGNMYQEPKRYSESLSQ